MVAKIQYFQDDIHRVLRDHFLSIVGKHGKSELLVAALAAKIPISERHFLRFLGIGGESWPRKGDLYYLLETLRQEGFFADLTDSQFAETIRAAYLSSGYSTREAYEPVRKFCQAGKFPTALPPVPVKGAPLDSQKPLFIPAWEFRTIRKLLDQPDPHARLIQVVGAAGCGKTALLREIVRRVAERTYPLQAQRVGGVLLLDDFDRHAVTTYVQQFASEPGALHLLVIDNLTVSAEFQSFWQGLAGQESQLRLLCAPIVPLAREPELIHTVTLGKMTIENAERLLCREYVPLVALDHIQRRSLLEQLGALPGAIDAFAARCRRLQIPVGDFEQLLFVAHSIRQPQPPPPLVIQQVVSLLDEHPERELLQSILERLGYTVDPSDPALLPPLPECLPLDGEHPEIHAAIAEQCECMADRALIRPTFEHWKAAGEANRAAQFLNRAAALGSSRENWVQERAWLLELQDWLLEERGWLLGQTLDDTTAELNILELTRLLLARGQPRQVIERLETLFRKALWTSDQRRIVFIQGELTANFINQADYLRARHVLLAMLRATERAHDKSGQAFALLNLALVANWSPEIAPAEAFDLAQRALALYNAIESHPYAMPIWQSRADCLAVLAQIHRKLGNTGEACRLEAQIRKLAEEHHDEHREYEAESYSREGFHLRAAGRYREALACYNRALQLHSRHSRRLASLQLAHRANLFVDTDHFFDALRDYEEARTVAHTLQDWRTYATITSNLGIAHLRQGDWREALRLQEEGITIVQTHQFPRSLVTLLTAKAESLLAGALWNQPYQPDLLEQAATALSHAFGEAATLLRISVLPTLAETYTALRAWPDTPDYELQAPGEYQRQGLMVIRLCLHQREGEPAQSVLNAMLQSGTPPLPQRAKLATWQGILLALGGQAADAAAHFRQAHSDAQRMLDFEAAYYPAQYDLALARAGLILVDKDPKAQLRRAQAEYRKAFNWCDAAGVLQEARTHLRELGALLDPKGVLAPLLHMFPSS